MARDFRAKQLRTSVIIGSGAIESNKNYLGLAFYSASKASNFDGGVSAASNGITDDGGLNIHDSSIGSDVWCLFDGGSNGPGQMGAARKLGSTILFLGDVVVSGSLFAERSSIEVNTTTTGDFITPDASSHYLAGGFGTTGCTIDSSGNISTDGFVQSNLFKNHANQDLLINTETDGNVVVTSAGGDVRFRATDRIQEVFKFNVVEPEFTIHNDGDVGDYFSIHTGPHGKTTISTVNPTPGEAAHLIMKVDGYTVFQSQKSQWLFGNNDENEYSFGYFTGSVNDFKWNAYTNHAHTTVYSIVNSRHGSAPVPSFRIDTTKKLEFNDDEKYIHHDGTNLTIVSDEHINLNPGTGKDVNIPADIGLTLGTVKGPQSEAGCRIEGDGTHVSVHSDGRIKLEADTAVSTKDTGIHIGGASNLQDSMASNGAGNAPIRIFKVTGDNFYGADGSNDTHENYPFNGTQHDSAPYGVQVGQPGDLVISNRSSVAANGTGAGRIIIDGEVVQNTGVFNSLTVTGDMNVQGSISTINTETITVSDPIIDIGGVENGDKTQTVDPSSDDGKDRGILARYFNGGAKRAFFGLDNDQDVFKFVLDATENAGVISGFLGRARFGEVQFGQANTYINQIQDNLAIVTPGKTTVSTTNFTIEQTASDQDTAPTLTLKTTDTGTNDGSVLRFEKKPADANSIVQYENLGEIYWYGSKGDSSGTFYPGAAIIAEAESDWQDEDSSEGANDASHATMLKFGTTSEDGNPGEDLTIRSDGKVGIGTVTPNAHLDVFSTSTQQRWSYDGGGTPSFATMTVADGSHTTIATGENGNVTIDSGGEIELDGFRIHYKNNGTALGHWDLTDGSDHVTWQDADNTSILGFYNTTAGNTAASVRVVGSTKLEIGAAERFIQFNNSNLQMSSNTKIELMPQNGGASEGQSVLIKGANSQLEFDSDALRIYKSGTELYFEDDSQDPVSLSVLNTTDAVSTLVASATSEDRVKIRGYTSIDSTDKYLNQAEHPANSHSDTWLYVGDGGGSRTKAVFKNEVAMSGSIRLVDQDDGLSQTILKQDTDNFILGMNQGAGGAIHDILTIEPAIGLKLGTTAGSGNAGLYFQDNDLNLQKVTHTVEGVASSKCIQSRGHILPQADNSFNLGTADRRFANLYTGDLHLNNMGSSNDVDGTAGNWTIQEGEDSLYVINNLTGKKFKMMLQPVEDGE